MSVIWTLQSTVLASMMGVEQVVPMEDLMRHREQKQRKILHMLMQCYLQLR